MTTLKETTLLERLPALADVADLMASDGRCQGQPAFQGFSLSLSLTDEAEAERLFAALSDGGQVQMPLSRTLVHRTMARNDQDKNRQSKNDANSANQGLASD